MTTVARRLAIVLLALTTAACALMNTGDPAVAAAVGDTRILTAEIDEYADAINSARAQQDATNQAGLDLQTTLVNVRVRSELLEHVVKRDDIQVSDADVDAVLEQQFGGREAFEEQMSQPGVPEGVRELSLQDARSQAILFALQEQVGEGDFQTFIRDQSADVGVKINPRYGRWDASTLQVQPTDPLSLPGEQASPVPAAP